MVSNIGLLTLVLLIPAVLPLPNGVGLLPEMGFNSWYAIHQHLVNYIWETGYCASADVLEIAQWFKSNGLLELGYNFMNFDDCIVVGRDNVTQELIPDPKAFPNGVLNVSRAFQQLGFKMGWYTVRGTTTCASGPPPRMERPGSYGHEAIDAVWYAKQEISYLKDDTCFGPNAPYTGMRDALNKSGNHVFFSLCEPGQGPVTAPVGRTLGNGWRVDEDDGGLWRPILDNVNMNAGTGLQLLIPC